MKIQLKSVVIAILVLTSFLTIIWLYFQPPKIDQKSADKINEYLHIHGIPEVPTN